MYVPGWPDLQYRLGQATIIKRKDWLESRVQPVPRLGLPSDASPSTNMLFPSHQKQYPDIQDKEVQCDITPHTARDE